MRIIQKVVFIVIFIMSLIIRSEVGCLEMLGVGGPEWVHSGDSLDLVCKYDLGRDHIYSVKWYKDNAEIWRYHPSDKTQNTWVFPLAEVQVLNSTRPHKLAVIVSGPRASGTYRCEVSVEKTFLTLSSARNLTVVVPPSSAPLITGGEEYYAEGHIINLICTSNMSKPAATLSWRINGKQAPSNFVVNRRSVEHSQSGLESSVLGLRFPATREYFNRGVAKIKCEAEIAGGVWATSQSQVLTGGDEYLAARPRDVFSCACIVSMSKTILVLDVVIIILTVLWGEDEGARGAIRKE